MSYRKIAERTGEAFCVGFTVMVLIGWLLDRPLAMQTVLILAAIITIGRFLRLVVDSRRSAETEVLNG